MTTLHEMAEQARQGGDMSPLFIPLKTEFYEGFLRGDKREEYRVHGPRWNEKTCRIGREVILSKGYGKQNRVRGVIVGFRVDTNPQALPGWAECYGDRHTEAACIEVSLL